MALFVCFGASTRETLKPYTYRPSVVLNGVGNIAAIARVRSHKIAAFPNLFCNKSRPPVFLPKNDKCQEEIRQLKKNN